MKQTAVEFLIQEIFGTILIGNHVLKKIKQAKEMEKEQIINAYCDGYIKPYSQEMITDAEQYYNETFKK